MNMFSFPYVIRKISRVSHTLAGHSKKKLDLIFHSFFFPKENFSLLSEIIRKLGKYMVLVDNVLRDAVL